MKMNDDEKAEQLNEIHFKCNSSNTTDFGWSDQEKCMVDLDDEVDNCNALIDAADYFDGIDGDDLLNYICELITEIEELEFKLSARKWMMNKLHGRIDGQN